MSWGTVLQRIKWDAAEQLIGSVDRELSEALSAYLSVNSGSSATGMICALSEYSYGSAVIQNGVPKTGNGGPFEPDFLHGENLPVGLIVENSLEVQLEDRYSNTDVRLPRTILGPGMFVGLFELYDTLYDIKHVHPQSWTILSGSESFHLPVALDTAQSAEVLKKHLGGFDASAFRDAGTVSQKLLLLPQVEDACRSWKSKVVYFSKGWFENLLNEHSNPEVDFVRSKLLDALTKHVWSTVTKVRDTGTRLYDHFDSQHGSTKQEAHALRSASALFSYLSDVITDRRPYFAPNDAFNHLGPSEAICNLVVKPFLKRPFAVVPRMLSESKTGIGYVPIAPFAQSRPRNGRDTITAYMEKIRNAYISCRDANGSDPVLTLAPHVIEQTSFRAAKPSNKKGATGSFEAFSFSADFQTHSVPLRAEEISSDEFFGVHLAKYPQLDGRFFQFCAKVDMSHE